MFVCVSCCNQKWIFVIIAQLKVLFTQFQHSGQMTIPPNALRVAMSSSYENLHRFQLGLMDDAAECFVRTTIARILIE